MNEIITHNHDGVSSTRLKTYHIIPSFNMNATQLTNYLSRPAINGERFTNYDGTNYREYIRINGVWKYASLS